MVIDSSAVAMSSGRAYKRQTSDRSSVSSWGEVLSATTSPAAKDSGSVTEKGQRIDTVELFQNYTVGGRYVRSARDDSSVTVVRMSLKDFFSLLIHRRQEDFERFMENFRSGMKMSTERKTIEVSSSEVETEDTVFSTVGKVTTADGRKIDFDMSLTMSRSYEKTSSMSVEVTTAELADPLVINFGTGSTELRDQTFRFDIDADGEVDNISMLGAACGFLAYDKNDDGKINDGSELFGAKSGNGFADLAIYDVDGNGWIDENDPIFDKLKIWSKDEDGRDVLVGLGVRGIGAIFLGNAPTEFSINDSNNQTLGVIRSSGVFLREDGSAGSVQQVDLAKLTKAS